MIYLTLLNYEFENKYSMYALKIKESLFELYIKLYRIKYI